MNVAIEKILVNLMKNLPVRVTSGIGAYLGKREMLRAIKSQRPWVTRFYGSLERLTGDYSKKSQKKRLLEFGGQLGRVYAEATILQKIDKKGLISIEGIENLQNVSQPAIFVWPHLSNWEFGLKLSQFLENPSCALYEPRENPERMAVINKARLAWSEQVQLISSDEAMVMKKIIQKIKQNVNIFILPDEEENDYVFAPSLGREIPYDGNRWMISRLAAKLCVDVVPIYVERMDSVKFKIHIHPKICPDSNFSTLEQAHQIADQIDDLFNQWVLKKPEHWYWLSYLDFKKQSPRK